jgi:ATP-dependent Clp protease ATP-binding subunit ClpX
MGGKSNAYCSFCRKSYRDVGPLVEGPGDVYICGDCIELCQSILDMERRRRGQLEARAVSVPPREEIRAGLDPVIRDEGAKDARIQAACHHYERDDGEQPSLVLLVGPTRSSRLLLARALAHAIGVPFAETRFGATEKQTLLFKLIQAGNLREEMARRGVFYVDGLDQRPAQEALSRPADWMRDESIHRMAQFDYFHARMRDESIRRVAQFDFSHILFIVGGEFAGLDEIVAGMGRHPERPVTGEALLALGVLPELVGRLSAIVRVPALDEETRSRIVPWVDFRRMTSRSDSPIAW